MMANGFLHSNSYEETGHFFLLALAWFAVQAEAVQPILVLAGGEPYNANGPIENRPHGPEVMAKMLQEAGSSFAIEYQPFARAQINLAGRGDAVLYAVARTPEREAQFRWIGSLADRSYYFYGLRSRKELSIKSLDDARRYRIGVVRKDVRAIYLQQNGFVEGFDAGLQEVTTGKLNMVKGRIEQFATTFSCH